MVADPATPSGRPLRHERAFVRLWIARAGSHAGVVLTSVALPLLVYQQTGSSLWTGLISFAQGLPMLLVSLPAGALADRFDRRRILFCAGVLDALVLLTVPVAAAVGTVAPAHLLAVALASVSTGMVVAAADFGAIPTLVGRDRTAAAQAAVFTATALGTLIVPAAAGAALSITATDHLLIVAALAAGGAAVLTLTISRPMGPRRDPAHPAPVTVLLAGLRYLWRHVLLRTQALFAIGSSLAASAFAGQIVPWADQTLDVDARDWRIGTFLSSWALGWLIACTIAPALIARLGETQLTLYAFPFAAVGAWAVVSATTWILAAAAIVVWAVGHELADLAAVVQRQRGAPDGIVSRVSTAGRMLSLGIGIPVGALGGGLLAQYTAPRLAVAAAAAVVTIAAIGAWLSPLRTATGYEAR